MPNFVHGSSMLLKKTTIFQFSDLVRSSFSHDTIHRGSHPCCFTNLLNPMLLHPALGFSQEGDPSRGTAFDHFRAERLAMSATTVLRLPDEGAEGT